MVIGTGVWPCEKTSEIEWHAHDRLDCPEPVIVQGSAPGAGGREKASGPGGTVDAEASG
jgi:hypothetical protein